MVLVHAGLLASLCAPSRFAPFRTPTAGPGCLAACVLYAMFLFPSQPQGIGPLDCLAEWNAFRRSLSAMPRCLMGAPGVVPRCWCTPRGQGLHGGSGGGGAAGSLRLLR